MAKKIEIKITNYKNCRPISDDIYCECGKDYHPIITTNNILLCENCIRPIHFENFDWQDLKEIY